MDQTEWDTSRQTGDAGDGEDMHTPGMGDISDMGGTPLDGGAAEANAAEDAAPAGRPERAEPEAEQDKNPHGGAEEGLHQAPEENEPAENPHGGAEENPHGGAEEGHTPQPPADGAGCGCTVYPEPCPPPVSAVVCGCRDLLTVEAGDAVPEGLGRMLVVDVRLRRICPNRRVALAVTVTEKDGAGREHPRGVKYLLVPAHHAAGCCDLLVKCVKFVLPEALDVSGGATDAICNARRFEVRTVANYVDTDFVCCHAE